MIIGGIDFARFNDAHVGARNGKDFIVIGKNQVGISGSLARKLGEAVAIGFSEESPSVIGIGAAHPTHTINRNNTNKFLASSGSLRNALVSNGWEEGRHYVETVEGGYLVNRTVPANRHRA